MNRAQCRLRLRRLTVWMAAAGCIAAPALAQTTYIIGDNTGPIIVTVPPDPLPFFNTLILGNAAGGDGTLNYTVGTLNIAHGGGYSGFLTVGNSGRGQLNLGNADGDTMIGITGPQYQSPPDAMTAPDPWGGYLFIGRNDGSNGSVVLTESDSFNALALNVQREIQIGGSNVSMLPGGGFSCAANCTGSFVQDGGTVSAGSVVLGVGAGVGSYALQRGTLTIGNGVPDRLVVGLDGQGTFTMSGGTLAITNQDVNTGAFVVGTNAGSTGTFSQTGGAVQGGRSLGIGLAGGTGVYNLSNADPLNNPTTTLSVGFISLGFSGRGTFNQGAGSQLDVGSLYIGADTGTYNLDSGVLNVTDTGLGRGTIVGTFNLGMFNQSGGTHNASIVVVGARNDANGSYLMMGGSLVVSDTLYVGLGHDGARDPNHLSGYFQQSGGSVNPGQIVIGGSTEVLPDPLNPGQFIFISHFGTGRYELSGGTVTANYTAVGRSSQGRVVQTGGTFNAGVLDMGADGMFVEQNGPDYAVYSQGIYQLSGGTLNTNGTTVSIFGQGTFLHSGTGTHNVTGKLVVGSQPGSSAPPGVPVREGVYTFQGGALNVSADTVIGAGNDGFVGEPGALGTFNQSGGTATLGGQLIIGGSGAVAGGTGVVKLSGGSLVTLGNVNVGGGSASGLLNVSGGSLSAPLIVNKDRLFFSGGNITANVSNSARFDVSGGAVRTLTGNLLNNAGGVVSVAAATTLAATGTFVNDGGTLKGLGALGVGVGALVNKGHVAPGNSPGTLTINGSFAQTAAGSLDIEVQTPGINDLLVVNGDVTLGGTLAVICYAACSYAVGSPDILVLDYSGSRGGSTFAALTLSGFGSGAFTTVYDDAGTAVWLHVTQNVTAAVPEPDTYLLMAGGLLVLWLARRRLAKSQAPS